MELYHKTIGGLTVETSPQLETLGIPHGFTTRMGGVSQGIWASLNLGKNRGDDPDHVRENYRRICEALGVDRDQLVFSRQVHGDAILPVTEEDAGKGLDRPQDREADALVTDRPGVVLTVFSADCLTALLYDPRRRVAAAVHAGWRGTALGILAKTAEKMKKDYGSRPEDIRAALGPCIGACCFETREDVPEAMKAALGGEALPYLSEVGEGRFRVDLKGLNALWLRKSGVLDEHMDLSDECTMCLPGKYWSHRRLGGERGSMAALISLGGTL